MNKSELLGLLGGVTGWNPDLDLTILVALDLPAEKLPSGYRLFNRDTRRWVVMPRPTHFLEDAIRLTEARRLGWSLRGGPHWKSGAFASVGGGGEWGGPNGAVALTRALVAHCVREDWRDGN